MLQTFAGWAIVNGKNFKSGYYQKAPLSDLGEFTIYIKVFPHIENHGMSFTYSRPGKFMEFCTNHNQSWKNI